MPRIKVAIPEHVSFEATIPVRITDLNYGAHLGNDALLSILHEARLQLLRHFGYTELDMGGASLIMADVAIEYKGEGFYGDVLTLRLAFDDVHKYGFDITYMCSTKTARKLPVPRRVCSALTTRNEN
ncbi:thioesterase family protein [Pontibacter sp. BAB1700]|uniref:acyl-CoA thioesterase n=1 Tax=Pontibacter sp. BAB1700 TaxID=1144253 RepID=UPI00026BBCC7|nr:thioesterase family protein [Pontibacter sp. BAB1700]EJF11779.1 esterase [Pontibacter sp. BAB1700]